LGLGPLGDGRGKKNRKRKTPIGKKKNRKNGGETGGGPAGKKTGQSAQRGSNLGQKDLPQNGSNKRKKKKCSTLPRNWHGKRGGPQKTEKTFDITPRKGVKKGPAERHSISPQG